MRIVIIAAMPEEAGAIAKILDHAQKQRFCALPAFRGEASGHEVIILEAGMGFENASSATRAIIREKRPDLLVSAGFCGGISNELNVGDVVIAERLFVVNQGVANELQVDLPEICRTFAFGQPDQAIRVVSGLFASSAVIMDKSELSALLPVEARFAVVEMETSPIAILAKENNIPIIGIRTVSDAADEKLGFSLDEFTDSSMRIRPHKVLLTILRKPWIIPQLIRLARNSHIAAKSLGLAVERLLAQL